MAAQFIGKMKSGKGKMFEVFWNRSDQSAYVAWGGKSFVGKANTATQAAEMAEVRLRNK